MAEKMNRWLKPEFKDVFPVACIMKHRLPLLWVHFTLPTWKRNGLFIIHTRIGPCDLQLVFYRLEINPAKAQPI